MCRELERGFGIQGGSASDSSRCTTLDDQQALFLVFELSFYGLDLLLLLRLASSVLTWRIRCLCLVSLRACLEATAVPGYSCLAFETFRNLVVLNVVLLADLFLHQR